MFIYGFRYFDHYQKSSRALFLLKDGNQQILNPKPFEKIVKDPFGEVLENQVFSLLVFVDPEKICPAVLDEVAIWTRPKQSVAPGIYDIHIFMVERESNEVLMAHFYQFGIPPGSISLIEENNLARAYTQFGAFKILYSLESGIVSYDFPNNAQGTFEEFGKKLLETVLEPSSKPEETWYSRDNPATN